MIKKNDNPFFKDCRFGRSVIIGPGKIQSYQRFADRQQAVLSNKICFSGLYTFRIIDLEYNSTLKE